MFRTAAVGRVKSLDPALIETSAEKMLISNLVDTLFERNTQNGEISPKACANFEVSSDGLQWRFFLRKDLFWSNGKAVRAKDFENALRRLLKPKTKSKIARKLEKIQGAQEVLDGAFFNPDNVGITSVDLVKSSELDITLAKPDPYLLQTLSDPATGPIPSEAYEVMQDQVFNIANWVSSGPFTVSQRSSTSFLLQKNRHYRKYTGIKIDEVIFFTLSSIVEGEKMFLSGLIDEFGYPDLKLHDETVASLSGTGFVTFQPDLKTVFVRLNTNSGPFSQFPFRQAIAMSVNHEQLMNLIGLEGQKAARSLMPEDLKHYDPPHGFYANAAEGKQMLMNLGYCVKNDCKYAPKITMIYPNTISMKKIAGAFANQIRETLSLKEIQLVPLDVRAFVSKVEKGDYVMALDELSVSPDDAFGMLNSFALGNPIAGGYHNEDFDSAIEQAAKSTSLSDAERIYREAESVLLRDIAIIPIVFEATPLLLHKRVIGYTPNIWNVHPFENLQLN